MAPYINFHSSDWAAIKAFLLAKKEIKTSMLIGSTSHDESNQLRGSLSMITEILRLEEAAAKAAQRK